MVCFVSVMVTVSERKTVSAGVAGLTGVATSSARTAAFEGQADFVMGRGIATSGYESAEADEVGNGTDADRFSVSKEDVPEYSGFRAINASKAPFAAAESTTISNHDFAWYGLAHFLYLAP